MNNILNLKLTRQMMLGVMGAAAIAPAEATAQSTTAKPTECDNMARPNILFVLVDDQSPFDLQIYNPNSTLETPVLDRLAREGMVMDAARHMGSMNGAVSTPSRHQIMSGRTVWHLPESAGAPSSNTVADTHIDTMTMGATFNRAGYKTMRTCKRGNSYTAANQLFTVVHEAVKRQGTEQGGSAWHAQHVLNYLTEREENNDQEPFLIFYGFSHPHDIRNGTPELLEKYGVVNHTDKTTLPKETTKVPLPENYIEQHPFHHGHPDLRDEVNVSGVWTKRDERTIKNEMGREYACSENIDIQLGRVLDKLEEMGELENTYIIYTADHGIAIGRHGLMGKQNLYEHSWRVPMIVWGPTVEPGSRVTGDVYLCDIFPTICDLAGIEIPETVQGQSFKPVMEGQTNSMREVMYGVYCGGTKPGMRSVVKGDWKLIKYDLLDGYIQETQLFNLKHNPYEYLNEHRRRNKWERNLAEEPKYAEVRAEMEKILLEQMELHDDPFRFWDQPQLPEQKK